MLKDHWGIQTNCCHLNTYTTHGTLFRVFYRFSQNEIAQLVNEQSISNCCKFRIITVELDDVVMQLWFMKYNFFWHWFRTLLQMFHSNGKSESIESNHLEDYRWWCFKRCLILVLNSDVMRQWKLELCCTLCS